MADIELWPRWICKLARGSDRCAIERRELQPYSFKMMFKTLGALSAFILAATLAIGATAQPSKEQGDSLARKIEGINQNAAVEPPRSKTTQVSEPEINSYLAFTIKDKIPRGLANPQIRLIGDGQVSGRVYVDLDEFKRQRSSGGMMDPLNYIAGQVPVNARGILRTKDGVGQFQLSAADIHGVPLPKPLVQELVSFFSRTQERPNGFNIDEPFNLPAKIRTITIKSAEALVVQ
jgi:hypothetical protein